MYFLVFLISCLLSLVCFFGTLIDGSNPLGISPFGFGLFLRFPFLSGPVLRSFPFQLFPWRFLLLQICFCRNSDLVVFLLVSRLFCCILLLLPLVYHLVFLCRPGRLDSTVPDLLSWL